MLAKIIVNKLDKSVVIFPKKIFASSMEKLRENLDIKWMQLFGLCFGLIYVTYFGLFDAAKNLLRKTASKFKAWKFNLANWGKEDQYNSFTCVVCYQNLRDIVSVPCQHLASCVDCLSNQDTGNMYNKCCICKQHVQDYDVVEYK